MLISIHWECNIWQKKLTFIHWVCIAKRIAVRSHHECIFNWNSVGIFLFHIIQVFVVCVYVNSIGFWLSRVELSEAELSYGFVNRSESIGAKRVVKVCQRERTTKTSTFYHLCLCLNILFTRLKLMSIDNNNKKHAYACIILMRFIVRANTHSENRMRKKT